MRRPGWTTPQTSAMYSFSTSRSWNCRDSSWCASIVLGHDHQPGRAAVEPMHDAGPQLAADAAEILDVMEQRVDQRAAAMAGRRMDDHSGRLVEHDEVAVLEDDQERQRLGLRHGRGRRGNVDRVDLAGAHRRCSAGADRAGSGDTCRP